VTSGAISRYGPSIIKFWAWFICAIYCTACVARRIDVAVIFWTFMTGMNDGLWHEMNGRHQQHDMTVNVYLVCSVVCAVRFIDDKTYQVSTTRCRLSLTIVELRKRVADKLRIPCAVVQILQHGMHDARFCRSFPSRVLSLDQDQSGDENWEFLTM